MADDQDQFGVAADAAGDEAEEMAEMADDNEGADEEEKSDDEAAPEEA